MRRRTFITLLGGAAAAWPLAGQAQQPAGSIRRAVVLMGAAETAWSRGWLASFLRRLDELGWREGRNLVTHVQWWNDQPEQMRAWVAELVARTPDVAVAFSNPALADHGRMARVAEAWDSSTAPGATSRISRAQAYVFNVFGLLAEAARG
jgi:ABC-type sugar transport system substrate-binding protein